MRTTTASEKTLTSKEAARLLGVSEASIKRWADIGLLPVLKTAGGHRRFRPEDIAIYLRNSVSGTHSSICEQPKRQIQSRSKSAVPDRKELASLLYKTLVQGRSNDAAAILVRLHLNGSSVADLADQLLCPVMRTIGDLWQTGELSVAEEHFATQTALEALYTLRISLQTEKPSGRSAICCSIEGDFHELPVNLAAQSLEASGWRVFNLSTSTPLYSLAEAVKRFKPRLVCVASTILLTGLDRAVRDYTELRKACERCGTSIVLGGRGFASQELYQRFSPDLYAENFKQLENFVSRMKN